MLTATSRPIWAGTFFYDVDAAHFNGVELTVWDRTAAGDVALGRALLNPAVLAATKGDRWLPLMPPTGRQAEAVGELQVSPSRPQLPLPPPVRLRFPPELRAPQPHLYQCWTVRTNGVRLCCPEANKADTVRAKITQGKYYP